MKARGGVGAEEEEMSLDGWLELSEITADPLQQVEKYHENLGSFKMHG